MIHRLPRIQLTAIAGICAACIVLTITGLTDMVLDADAAQRAQDTRAATTPPDQSRQIEALLDLFAFCQTAAWDDPKCRPESSEPGSIIDVLGNAGTRDDDDGNTRVTVRTEERDTPTPTRTSAAPQPRPTATSTPDDDPDELTDPVEDLTKPIEDLAKQLADVTAPTIGSSE